MSSARSTAKSFFSKNLTNRQKLTFRLSLLAAVAIAVALIGGFSRVDLSALVTDAEPSTEADRPLPVSLAAAVEVASFERGRIYTGVIKAARQSDVGFERTGRLDHVLVNEGDHVEQGQLLAQLDIRNLQARKNEIEAQRDAAQARLDELVAGPRTEVIAAARADVRQWEAQAELAQLRFDRSEALLKKRAISKDEFDERTIGLRSVNAQLDAARHRLEELEAGTRDEQLAASRAIVSQLEASLKNIDVDLEKSRLYAPFAGTIAERRLDEGAIVAPNAVVLRILEAGKLEAWIGVPIQTANRLEAGDTHSLRVAGRVVPGAVASVIPEVNSATRTQTVIYELPPNAAAVTAQIVRVEIKEQVSARGYWAPTAALSRGERGLWSLLVAEGETDDRLVAARRDVELLYTDGDRVLVSGALTAGERIVAEGAHRVAHGQAISDASR